MAHVQMLGALGFAVVVAFLCIGLAAQAGDPATLIQNKLISPINKDMKVTFTNGKSAMLSRAFARSLV
jgi:hypothetical protein